VLERRLRLRLVLSLAGALAVAATPASALAQDDDHDAPKPAPAPPTPPDIVKRPELPAERKRLIDRESWDNPFRGSILQLDQSMTTQTAHVQPSPEQSYVPLYEVWVSLRPRYYFDQHWNVRARFDYTKELTNEQNTTFYREDVFLDIWTDLVYTTFLDRFWKGTKVNLGVRALWPTSKASQGAGAYVTLGGLANGDHTFFINGDEADWLPEAHLRLGITYLHPFTKATTPTQYGGFQYVRQDIGVDDRSILSDQLTGTTIVAHTLLTALEGSLSVTPKLEVSLSAILVNQWHYPVPNQGVSTVTGTVNPTPGGTLYTPNVWVIAGVSYQLFDELELGLGYYNLAGEIAPDGKRRGLFGSDNVFWSPDARVFFDITAHLDALFDDAVHHRYSKPSEGGKSASVR
jgi:hypothetical protein